jgi:large subunit ribosomal protein L15
MKLHELAPPPGAKKARKRLGRGTGSGLGKTSGRGHKGQKARSGGGVRPGFEGGQMPLHRRLPKRGFRPYNRKQIAIVHLGDIAAREDLVEITPESLVLAGLVRKIIDGVKILGDGEIAREVRVSNVLLSKSAREKIVQAGGQAEE